ncbi:potassium channel family protein [Aminipila terrae]|uniref:RCK N-terminal domain-containing protein n=1 Tax=Aminipila terrae TaxID=2697030 RepID=A0A6P1MMU7_9FIRM|nr:NAD-binding protein [Aminipila terrae]QHI72335.1 hypothetical protein Ami3637_07900 [Aminipila terrae]
MKILLAGDTKLSGNIIHTLLQNRHSITVLNTDMDYCQQLADQYEELTVLNADNTDIVTLEEANVKKFDSVIAVSDYDSVNFVFCQLCKDLFGIKRLAAIINCPGNAEIFRKLGVDILIDKNSYFLSCIG